MSSLRSVPVLLGFLFSVGVTQAEGDPYPKDEFPGTEGPLVVTFFGHASLLLEYQGLALYVDPVGQFVKDPASLPKADLILITHEHGDHLDPALVQKLSGSGTEVITNARVADQLKRGTVMANGQKLERPKVSIEAVPAYNLSAGRDKFHPRGRDNGFILTLAGQRLYIAGDTEDIPEMAGFKGIDVAFLPVNQPYTMTADQFVHAVAMVSPKVVYPYHLGDTDLALLAEAAKRISGTDVRVRDLK